MHNLTPEELIVVRKLLLTIEVQNLVGTGEWNLTDEEEETYWVIFKKLQSQIAEETQLDEEEEVSCIGCGMFRDNCTCDQFDPERK